MNTGICLKEIDKEKIEELNILKYALDKQIKPLYGDQTKSYEKALNKDRKCFILFNKEKPVGLLIYKMEPSNEFQSYGIYKSIEIKTLIVIDPEINSNKGYASKLLEQVYMHARKISCGSIHVTVCEDREDSCTFFKKKSFRLKARLYQEYRQAENELLLHKTFYCNEE